MMTTVISVNQTVSDQISDIGVGDDGGMLRPETAAAAITRTNSNRSANDTKDILIKGKKLGHRRVKDGEVTYKKFETTQLMGSIQLGIQQSVGNLGCQEDRDLLHVGQVTSLEPRCLSTLCFKYSSLDASTTSSGRQASHLNGPR